VTAQRQRDLISFRQKRHHSPEERATVKRVENFTLKFSLGEEKTE